MQLTMSRHTLVLAVLAAPLAAALLWAPAAAQSVVVPDAHAGARGTASLNTLTRNRGVPRTYLLGLDAAQLAGIPVGSSINGLSFRSSVTANNTALWPPYDASFADYEISIGNVILQGHNTTDGVDYDIYWDNFGTAVPAPGALALLGCAGLVGARRRRA